MKFQAQAVLRRSDPVTPLRLAGVLVAGSFYPATAQEAWGPLHLEGGLVALAPLSPLVEDGPERAAATALTEALRDWGDGHGPGGATTLRWRPMDTVREPADGRTITQLIEGMTAANEARLDATPSTPPYHGAARDLERLAALVYDTSSSEERIAEDGALEDGRGLSDALGPRGAPEPNTEPEPTR